MLCIFLTDDVLSSKVPQLTLRIADGDCIVKFQITELIDEMFNGKSTQEKILRTFKFHYYSNFNLTNNGK